MTRRTDARPRIPSADAVLVRSRVETAAAGLGLASVPEDSVAEALADGRLVRLLEAWTPSFTGYHLYYPSRRQHTAAFSLLVDALRR